MRDLIFWVLIWCLLLIILITGCASTGTTPN
ncbi:unnamed protein product, partial [marine sediment metagenome]